MATGLVVLGVGLIMVLMPAGHSGVPFLLWGLGIVIAVAGERWRYSRTVHHGGGRWQRTQECFEDPETGVIMDVFYDPVSGERRYEPREKT